MSRIHAPWTDSQVEALNSWQRRLGVPALTCDGCDGLLTPTPAGLECRALGCRHSTLTVAPAVCFASAAIEHAHAR